MGHESWWREATPTEAGAGAGRGPPTRPPQTLSALSASMDKISVSLRAHARGRRTPPHPRASRRQHSYRGFLFET